MGKLEFKRKSNFELLRIISMLFIIGSHYGLYTIDKLENSTNFANNFIFSFFRSGGQLGVILFILTTGYFMIKSETKVKKIISLELQVLFYSIGSLILWLLLGRNITIQEVSKSIFPNIMNTYWFFTSYFAIYIFIPFINKFLLGLNKKEFQKLLILGFIFLMVIPTIVISSATIHGGIYLLYFYTLGAYFRLNLKNDNNKKNYLIMACISYLIIILISIVIKHLSITSDKMLDYTYYFSKKESVLMFVCATSLFLFFKNINIKYNPLINKIANVSFGVYIFHENIFIKQILWKELFVINPNNNFILYFITCILSIIVIYIIGGIIELARQKLFEYIDKKICI